MATPKKDDKSKKAPVKKTVKKPAKKAPVKKEPEKAPEPQKVVENVAADLSSDFLTMLINADGTAKDEAVKTYEPEPNNTNAPKNFMIRCPKCRWARLSSGLDADMVDMSEINRGCRTCGKWRKFRCKKCGAPSAMARIRGNS